MSEELVSSPKKAKTNKVSEARKEIEKLKTELESLINSNILKKNALLQQSNTNLIIKSVESVEPVSKIDTQIKKVTVFKKAALNPTKVINLSPKKSQPPIENVEEPPKIKTKHYDPKSTRDYIKKQKLQRKTKEEEEKIKKKELEDLKRQKLQELRQKTLELMKKSGSCLSKKLSAKSSSDLKIAQTVNSAQVNSFVRKNAPFSAASSRRVRPRSFDRESASNISNKSKQSNVQRRARSLSRDSKLSDQQTKSDLNKTPDEPNLEKTSKKEDIVESIKHVSKLLEKSLDLNERNKAAMLIQATFKGYQQRKKYSLIQPKHILSKNIPSSVKSTDSSKNLNELSKDSESNEQSEMFERLKQHISKNDIHSDNIIRKPVSFLKSYPENITKLENDPFNFISTVRRNLEATVTTFKIKDPQPKIEIVDVSTQLPSIRDKINVSVQCDMYSKVQKVKNLSPEFDFDTFKSHKIRNTSKALIIQPKSPNLDFINPKLTNQTEFDETDFSKKSPMHIKRNRDLILNDPTEPDPKIYKTQKQEFNVSIMSNPKIHIKRNRDLILNDPTEPNPKKSLVDKQTRDLILTEPESQKSPVYKLNLSDTTLSKTHKSPIYLRKYKDQILSDLSDADTTKNIPEITEEETPISRKSRCNPIQDTDHLKNVTFSRQGNDDMEPFFDLEKPLTKLNLKKKQRSKFDLKPERNMMELTRSDLRLNNDKFLTKNDRKSISDSSVTNSERSRSASNRFNNRESLSSSISSIRDVSNLSSNSYSKYPADINSILDHYSKKSSNKQYSDDFPMSSQSKKSSSQSTNSKSQSKNAKSQSIKIEYETKLSSTIQTINNESYSPKSLSENTLDLKSETINSLQTSNIVNSMTNGNHSFNKNATNEHKAEVQLLNSFNRSLEQAIAVEKSLNEIQDKENSFSLVDNSLCDKSVIDGRYSTVNYKRGCDISNVTLGKSDKSIPSPRHFLFDQMIRDEDERLDHLKAILKLRNKALFDRIKGELTWLEIQKKELRESGQLNHVTMIKKKQRGLLIKLEQERHEMIRLKQAHKQAAEERKHALRQQKSLIKHQLSSNEQIPAKIKRLSRTESRQSGPLKVYHKNSQPDQYSDSTMSSSQLGDTSRFEPSKPKSLNSSRSTSPAHTENLKQALLMKEEALEKRRKNVEEILEWHNRLKAEEVRVTELELKARAIQTHQKQLEKRKHLTGSQLNRIWNSISGSPRKRFDDTETYPMCSIANAIKVLLKIAENEYSSGKSTEESYTSDFDKGNSSLDELHTKFSLANSSTTSLDSKVTEHELVKIVEVSDQTMKTGKMSELPEDIKQFSESNKTSILSEILSQEPTISSENKSIQVASVSSSATLKHSQKLHLKKTMPEMIIEKCEIQSSDTETVAENKTSNILIESIIKSESFEKTPPKTQETTRSETERFENEINSEYLNSPETSYINEIADGHLKTLNSSDEVAEATEIFTSELKSEEKIVNSSDELIVEVPVTGSSEALRTEVITDLQSDLNKTEKYFEDIPEITHLSETSKSVISTSFHVPESVYTEDILETGRSSHTIKSDVFESQNFSDKSNTELIEEATEAIESETEKSNITATVTSDADTEHQDELSRSLKYSISSQLPENEAHTVKSEIKNVENSINSLSHNNITETSTKTHITESLRNSTKTEVEISFSPGTENSNSLRISEEETELQEVISEKLSDKSQVDTSNTIKSDIELSYKSEIIKSKNKTEELTSPEMTSVKSQVEDSTMVTSETEKPHLIESFISEPKTENAQVTTNSDTLIINTTETLNNEKSDVSEEDNISDKSETGVEINISESEISSYENESPESPSLEQISGVEIVIHERDRTEIKSLNDSFESDHSSTEIKSELHLDISESARTDVNILENAIESATETKTEIQETISNSFRTEIKSEAASFSEDIPKIGYPSVSEKTESATLDKLIANLEITEYVSSKSSDKSTTKAEITETSSAKDFESDMSSKTEMLQMQTDIPENARTESKSEHLNNSLSAISDQSSENVVPDSARSSSEAKTESEINKSEEISSEKIAIDSSNETTEVSQKDDHVSETIVSPPSSLNNRDRLVKPYISEAEELLRKQLEIEQEIKQLEREAIPYLFMREIPNKPPPPYKPPVFPLTPVIKSVVPVQETEIIKYVAQAADRLFPTVKIGKPDFQCLNTSGKITAQRFIFDLCRELVSAILKPNESEIKIVPSWKKPTKSQLNTKVRNVPLTKRRLEEELKRKVLHVLDIKPAPRVDSVIAKWSRKKRDHVDNILVSEAQAEEAQWVNYDRDEQTIKDKLTDEILNKLILEAFYDFSDILIK